MTQSAADWFIYSLNPQGGPTGRPVTGATLDTTATGAGQTLEISERFTVAGTTYAYDGVATATAPSSGTVVTGFRAHIPGTTQKFFFAENGVPFAGWKATYVTTIDPLTDKPVFVDGTVICFYPGTRIRTPDGEAAVETLAIGDLVLTADGQARPVRWVGRQTVATLFAD
ncbi:hypothetical protein E2C05_31985, partial [Paracraurococcus ruber]